MKKIKFILYLVAAVAIGIAGVWFAVANPERVEVDFLACTLEASLSAFLIGAFVLGSLVGLLASTGIIASLKLSRRRMERERSGS